MSQDEQIIISKTINKFDKRITRFAKDTCTTPIKYDWIIKHQHIVETIHIQSAVTKMIQHIINVSKSNKETPLYEKAKKLYNRCDELLTVLDQK